MLYNLICFVVSYVLVFLFNAFVINRNKKTYQDAKKQTEVDYIINKFNLDRRKVKYNKIKWILNFINPLIISLTFIVIVNIDNFIVGVLVGFVMMILLIISLYEIIGRILKKKGEKDEL